MKQQKGTCDYRMGCTRNRPRWKVTEINGLGSARACGLHLSDVIAHFPSGSAVVRPLEGDR